MDIFLYAMIFIAGTVFGSFCTLAVYRIPRKENITYVRSHCVSCNHELSFWDLIPIWSYIFLRGRCRYCKEKIRSRYILLEISSGLVFLLIAFALKINIFSTVFEFVELFLIYLFITGVFLIGGIDKENYIIPDGIILYLIGISCAYILLNSFNGIYSINNLIGFILIPVIFILINIIFKLAKAKEAPIGFGDIKYISTIGLFLGFGMQIIILPFSLILSGMGYLIHRYKQIPFGFYLSIATTISIIISPYLTEFLELISVY